MLLDEYGNIKLCDFGWSSFNIPSKKDAYTEFCGGTLDYMAPEIIFSNNSNEKIDVWSLGIFLFEMIAGYTPFENISLAEKFKYFNNKNSKNLLFLAFNSKMVSRISIELKELIEKMLIVDPEKRIDFQLIFEHKWMKKHEKYFKIKIDELIFKKNKNIKNSQSELLSLFLNEIEKTQERSNNDSLFFNSEKKKAVEFLFEDDLKEINTIVPTFRKNNSMKIIPFMKIPEKNPFENEIPSENKDQNLSVKINEYLGVKHQIKNINLIKKKKIIR